VVVLTVLVELQERPQAAIRDFESTAHACLVRICTRVFVSNTKLSATLRHMCMYLIAAAGGLAVFF
jgi:hypothetical protein